MLLFGDSRSVCTLAWGGHIDPVMLASAKVGFERSCQLRDLTFSWATSIA